MLSNASDETRSYFIVDQSLFFKIFIFENDRSLLKLDTINAKYILKAISTLEM
jgi:hypothetical protein